MTRSPSTRKMASINSDHRSRRTQVPLGNQLAAASAVRARRELDVDLQGRDALPALHPHNNLVGIERNMPRYRGQDFLPQQRQQIGLLAPQSALMREQDLQPLPRDRRRGRDGAGTAGKQPKTCSCSPPSEQVSSGPCGSLGTIIGTVSPSRPLRGVRIGAGGRAGRAVQGDGRADIGGAQHVLAFRDDAEQRDRQDLQHVLDRRASRRARRAPGRSG